MNPSQSSIIIRLAGDSGDGVQLIGEELTITAALSGKEVRTLPDFPAEIRAPQGTVSGVSGFQLAMASEALFTAGEELDVLVALNPAALKKALPSLKSGGLLILNEDSQSSKDWTKAGIVEDDVPDMLEHYQVIHVPLVSETVKALEDVDVSTAEAKKAKNFYVLGLVLWLFELDTAHALDFIKQKFKAKPDIQKGNQKALQAGYNFGLTLELQKQNFVLNDVPRAEGDYRQITGIDAVAMALATLATETNTRVLVSGYPITPASAVLHAAAPLKDFGVELIQAEDEIASIGAALGAAYGGALALTCTSGPGLDLKTEMMGLAVVAELPLVILDVQRAGTSTGLPTKTGQSDLNQALFGRHGEAPMPVLAATSPADCFETILSAFRIAVKAMTPVIVLMDAYLANAAEPWLIPDINTLDMPNIQYHTDEKPYARNEHLARSWNTPGKAGFIHQLGGLEKAGVMGEISYEPENHAEMVNLRAEKVFKVSDDYAPLSVEGDKEAEVLLVSWGSTYGSIQAARAALDMPVSHVHLKHLWPLPPDLEDTVKAYKHVLVLELNTGHLCALMRAQYLVDAKSIGVCTGQPFTTTALVSAIQKEVEHV